MRQVVDDRQVNLTSCFAVWRHLATCKLIKNSCFMCVFIPRWRSEPWPEALGFWVACPSGLPVLSTSLWSKDEEIRVMADVTVTLSPPHSCVSSFFFWPNLAQKSAQTHGWRGNLVISGGHSHLLNTFLGLNSEFLFPVKSNYQFVGMLMKSWRSKSSSLWSLFNTMIRNRRDIVTTFYVR